MSELTVWRCPECGRQRGQGSGWCVGARGSHSPGSVKYELVPVVEASRAKLLEEALERIKLVASDEHLPHPGYAGESMEEWAKIDAHRGNKVAAWCDFQASRALEAYRA